MSASEDSGAGSDGGIADIVMWLSVMNRVTHKNQYLEDACLTSTAAALPAVIEGRPIHGCSSHEMSKHILDGDEDSETPIARAVAEESTA